MSGDRTLIIPPPTPDQQKYLSNLQNGYMTPEQIAAEKTPIGPPRKLPSQTQKSYEAYDPYSPRWSGIDWALAILYWPFAFLRDDRK